MVTITRILSDAQNEINDIAGERVQLGEWLDMLYDVAMEVAAKTEIWIARYTTTPNPTSAPVTPEPTSIHIPYTDANGNVLSPFRLLRVTVLRNGTWYETREYSFQAIDATAGGARSFYQNNYQLDSQSFRTGFIDGNGVITDGRTITFPVGFAADEAVNVDFIQSVPFTYNLWSTPVNAPNIPDFLVNTFREGMKWRAMERLFNKGDDSYMPRADRAKMNYEKYLREAMGYSHNLLDKNSMLQMRPHIWLPE